MKQIRSAPRGGDRTALFLSGSQLMVASRSAKAEEMDENPGTKGDPSTRGVPGSFVIFSEFRRPEERAVGVGTAGGSGQMVKRTGLHGSRAALQGLQGCSVHESVWGPQPGPHMHPNPAHLFCWSATGRKAGAEECTRSGHPLSSPGEMELLSRAFPSRRGRTEMLSFPGEEILRAHNLRGFVFRYFFSSYG